MPELTLLYVHGAQIGYGRLGVALHAGLSAAGVDVYDRQSPVPQDSQAEQAYQTERARPQSTFDPKIDSPYLDTNTACWVSVPSHAKRWLKDQHLAIVTMWEATKLPQTFRENLHSFDQVIVPSMHNVELFSKYHDNVAFMPLGVDPQAWHYEPRQELKAQFRFMVAGSGTRKGVDLAITAFSKLYGREGSWKGRTPILVLKDPKGEALDMDAARGVPRIEHIPGYLSAEEETALYQTANCYLQPSRGEGFGLQPLQAIAQGIPTILTNAHGHESFAHLGYPLSTRFVPADYFIHGDAGEWWEPSLDDLCDHMAYVYENYETALDEAKQAAATVSAEWTWANTVDRFREILGPELDTPYAGDGTWVAAQATLRRFRVQVDRPMTLEAAGYVYIFEVGKNYWEPADIKRMLFELNALSADCCNDDDPGLMPTQIAALGKYEASKATCPTCGQIVNSGIKESDRLFEEMLARHALESR